MFYLLFITVFCMLMPYDNIAVPVYSKCFDQGTEIRKYTSKHGLSEICIKDDISMIKTISKAIKNDSGVFHENIALRKMIVQDWRDCKPRKSSSGNINLVELDPELMVSIISYSCSSDCSIGLDRDKAEILLSTETLNKYEVTGTTRISGWFKTKTHIPLHSTCEHLHVTCGSKAMQFHACFKRHMSCIRYLDSALLPQFIIVSFCENIELIILLTVILITFSILSLMMKTYLCYLLLPIFIPIAYLYGFIYNRRRSKCLSCGLAYHPFTNCKTHCVCGAKFETSDRIRLHRESGLCPGYKSMRAARVLCKSKGSASLLSIILSILLLSFVTPINAFSIVQQNNETIDILNQYKLYKANSENIPKILMVVCLTPIIALIINLIIIILSYIYRNTIIKRWIYQCQTCDLYHIKHPKLKDHCSCECVCGFSEDKYIYDFHKSSEGCVYKYNYKLFKFTLSLLFITVIISSLIGASVAESCTGVTDKTLNCLPAVVELECQTDIDKVIEKMITDKKIHSLESTWVKSIYKNYLDEIKNVKSIHEAYIADYAYNTLNCKYYTSLKSNSDLSQLEWRNSISHYLPKFCSTKNQDAKNFCSCLQSNWAHCDDTETSLKKVQDFYTTNMESSEDLNIYTGLLFKIFPGTVSMMFNDHIRNNKKTEAVKILEEVIKKFTTNKLLTLFLKMLKYIVNGKISNYSQLDIAKYYKVVSMAENTMVTDLILGIERNNCPVDIKFVQCKLQSGTNIIGRFILCEADSKKYIYESDGFNYFKVNGKYCVNDRYCGSQFPILPNESIELVKTLKCSSSIYTENIESPYYKSSNLCRIDSYGSGKINNAAVKLIKAKNNLIYQASKELNHAQGVDIGLFCFSKDCKLSLYPIHPLSIKDLSWDNDKSLIKEPPTINHDTFETYKKSLLEDIKNNLEIHNFKPVKNLPHVKPIYKYITIQGTETEEGVEEAYIEFEIPAIAGNSIGFKISTKDNIYLFDIIVHINRADLLANFKEIYETGPTIGINSKHDEMCTGSCPVNITKNANWLTFARERTSQWGCEEFGCLAINEGCLYGSCQDIIKPEIEVYKKINLESPKIELCITASDFAECIVLETSEAVITDSFQAQLSTIQTNLMPNILALQNHKLYKGQINDLGSLDKQCGSVQKINTSLIGSGIPKFDYLCHAASRKEVIIRKCYDNHFDSCRFLEETNYIFKEQGNLMEVTDSRLKIGNIKAKFKMGDIKYKLIIENAAFEVNGECVGCINCIEGIACSLTIVSENIMTCPIQITNCVIHYDQIKIESGSKTYNIKLECKDVTNQLSGKICKKDINLKFSKITGSTNIEINNSDQTAYIRETDNRCGTWLCKVYAEGFTGLFDGLFNWFTNAGKIVIIVITIIILLILIKYVILPIANIIISILKKNEYRISSGVEIKII
uniref:Envelopment polyprotein n=1 Tax=Kaeng Khoi virus TaxID=307164 RepID=A0A218NGP7_9VIRU|nr:glycoprotein precursor [Kaeng Khoi virus]